MFFYVYIFVSGSSSLNKILILTFLVTGTFVSAHRDLSTFADGRYVSNIGRCAQLSGTCVGGWSLVAQYRSNNI